ncbi:MAG: hypothetical protein ACYSOL_01890 [Planctomycetota bacterium]|jgi:hypothetical protein
MMIETVVGAQDLHVGDFVIDEGAFVVAVDHNLQTERVAVRFDNGMRWSYDEDFVMDIRATDIQCNA